MMELEPKRKEMVAMSSSYASVNDSGEDNRRQFGVPEESSLGDGLGEGYGMLGQAGSGKLRISAGRSKLVCKSCKEVQGEELRERWSYFRIDFKFKHSHSYCVLSYFFPLCCHPDDLLQYHLLRNGAPSAHWHTQIML
ncbi:hypothetical protein Dimus_032275 [Dionaea muscipula]